MCKMLRSNIIVIVLALVLVPCHLTLARPDMNARQLRDFFNRNDAVYTQRVRRPLENPLPFGLGKLHKDLRTHSGTVVTYSNGDSYLAHSPGFQWPWKNNVVHTHTSNMSNRWYPADDRKKRQVNTEPDSPCPRRISKRQDPRWGKARRLPSGTRTEDINRAGRGIYGLNSICHTASRRMYEYGG